MLQPSLPSSYKHIRTESPGLVQCWKVGALETSLFFPIRITPHNVLKELSFPHCPVGPESQNICSLHACRPVQGFLFGSIGQFGCVYVSIAWSQLLQLYNNLDINKIHFFIIISAILSWIFSAFWIYLSILELVHQVSHTTMTNTCWVWTEMT